MYVILRRRLVPGGLLRRRPLGDGANGACGASDTDSTGLLPLLLPTLLPAGDAGNEWT